MDLNIEALLTPISGDNPAGEDMLFSSEIDALKEARRFDDPTLSLGEWEKEIKKADWPKVEAIAFEVLTNKSKDLQFAVWLVEALTQQYQFEGVSQGLLLVRRLLQTFWDTLYPAIEDNDLIYRAAPIEWLTNNYPSVIYFLPLTSGESRKCSWQDIQQAREVDNLGRKDPEAMQRAIAEGKLTQADADKSLKETSDEFILERYESLELCRQNITDLDKTISDLFGKDAPSLREISNAIDNVYGFIARTAKDRQLIDVSQAELDAMVDSSGNTVAEKRQTYTGGPIQTREDALRVLSEVSIYFKKSEPHSPIYFLLDRAVKWGQYATRSMVARND
jgi:type VI secretion system protein ImpA